MDSPVTRNINYWALNQKNRIFFPLRKVNLKAVNTIGLAAPGGKVRVIVVAFVKAVKCGIGETIVDVAEKTSRARTK